MKKVDKLIKKEKLLWILILLSTCFFYPLINVITSAKLSETNIEVERIKKDIDKQTKVNESISMQINELSSLEKIREIAGENGLTYKNNNTTVIDGDN